MDIATAVLTKGAGLATSLVITPVCFGYLGDQRYGLWMAITSLTGMAWFADLGLGNGLLTRLSQLGADARQRAREISGAYATLGSLAVAMLVVLFMVNSTVPWAGLFGVTDPAVAGEASLLALLCFGAFAVNVPLSLIHRVQYASGQATQTNSWQAAGAALSMVAVLVATGTGQAPLTVIACAVLAVPLTNLVNTLVYFGFQEPAVRPGLKMVHRSTATGLLRLGLRFFAVTSLATIARNLDNPIGAYLLGPAVVAHYAVVGKLFGVITVFVGLVGLTVWPAYGAALAAGQVEWTRRTTRRLMLLSGATVGVLGVGVTAFGHRLLALWVGELDTSVVPVAVLAWLALWVFLTTVTLPMILVQNSIGLLGPQFLGWAAFLLLAVALKFWGLRTFGLVALPATSCVAYVVTVLPAAVVGYRSALNRSRPDPQPAERGSDDPRPAQPVGDGTALTR